MRPSPGEMTARRKTPWNKTIIYELHVKGMTRLNQNVPEQVRGTYAGLGSESAIRYLEDLGITAVELLPVHEHVDERRLVEQGLVNYWGYNTLGFFAPEHLYSAAGSGADSVREFKTMVRNLHSAGIEVILDVVYNHTPKAIKWGRPCRFAASTMPRITAFRPRITATTSITPAAGTPSTCATHACCS